MDAKLNMLPPQFAETEAAPDFYHVELNFDDENLPAFIEAVAAIGWHRIRISKLKHFPGDLDML